MIFSRIGPTIGLSKNILKNVIVKNPKTNVILNHQKRWAGGGQEYLYRQAPPMPKIDTLTMVLMSTFWWWNFWHLFSDWEELFGPFGLEKAESWTDEELGIPPLE